MEIQARVVAVLEPQSGMTKNGEWKSQTIIVMYQNGEREQRLALTNKRYPDEFGKIPVGAEGTFKISPHSNEYNGKWYTETICYNWNVTQSQQQSY